MKKLIDISDEDALAVINRIHILTENRILGRFGLLGLDFHESFRRYGSAYMDFELASYDFVSDGHYSCEIHILERYRNHSWTFTSNRVNCEPIYSVKLSTVT